MTFDTYEVTSAFPAITGQLWFNEGWRVLNAFRVANLKVSASWVLPPDALPFSSVESTGTILGWPFVIEPDATPHLKIELPVGVVR